MFLSKHYAANSGYLERRAAQERAFKETGNIFCLYESMIQVFQDTDTVGYQDLRQKTIEEIYEILKKKLSPGKAPLPLAVQTESIDNWSEWWCNCTPEVAQRKVRTRDGQWSNYESSRGAGCSSAFWRSSKPCSKWTWRKRFRDIAEDAWHGKSWLYYIGTKELLFRFLTSTCTAESWKRFSYTCANAHRYCSRWTFCVHSKAEELLKWAS